MVFRDNTTTPVRLNSNLATIRSFGLTITSGISYHQ